MPRLGRCLVELSVWMIFQRFYFESRQILGTLGPLRLTNARKGLVLTGGGEGLGAVRPRTWAAGSLEIALDSQLICCKCITLP